MEQEIAMAASGYVLARIAVLAAFGYLFYRILRRRPPTRVKIDTQSRYAKERLRSTRSRR